MKTCNSTDKRVLKTKHSLKTSLIMLLSEKDIDEISVVELSERAFVNRKTFYLHYDEVKSVLKEIEDELIEKIISKLKTESVEFSELDDYVFDVLNIINNNQYAFNLLRCKKYNDEFISKITKTLIDFFTNKSTKRNDENLFFINYHIHGSLKMYYNWLNNSYKGLTFEELCELLSKAIIKGFK